MDRRSVPCLLVPVLPWRGLGVRSRLKDLMARSFRDVKRLRIGIVIAGCLGMGTAACTTTDVAETPVNEEPFVLSTTDPTLVGTVRASAEETAQWIGTSQPATLVATDEPFPTVLAQVVDGADPATLRGECEASDGSALHARQGFCVVAPEDWVPLNIDGGLAIALGTTPGQALTLRPAWAADTSMCQLTLYIFADVSAEQHLQRRHEEFGRRGDLDRLTPVQSRALAGMSLFGFSWGAFSGRDGSVYAAALDDLRAIHISFGGTDCSADDLAPVLESLRFNDKPITGE